jgi:DNA-binding response OmpR family regulator
MAKQKKILLVEDDADLREELFAVLEENGFQVTQVGDGDAGQFMSFLSEFDLIVSDVKMPKVDGQEMIEFIKKRLSVPVIIITGLPKQEVQQKFTSLPPNLILTKPFSIPEFLSLAKELTKK